MSETHRVGRLTLSCPFRLAPASELGIDLFQSESALVCVCVCDNIKLESLRREWNLRLLSTWSLVVSATSLLAPLMLACL